MKQTGALLILLQLWFISVRARPVTDTAFYKPVHDWFSAWELLSRDIYGIRQVRPVEFVFFDDQYIYSTSRISAPAGSALPGPRLMNLSMAWRKESYKDSITLPDGTRLGAGILSFAGVDKHQQPFFVMPLPSFWKKAGVQSGELGTEKLVTGVFLHEFSHTQQVRGLGRQVTALEKKYWKGIDLSDDIIQQRFGSDSLYKTDFERETRMFYALAIGETTGVSQLWEAVSAYRHRQRKHFTNPADGLNITDDLFLTMEGLGQFSMYAWLVHPKGGATSESIALAGVRRGKKWWSQEEGLALFLALSRFRAPGCWGPRFFGRQPLTVIRLLEQMTRPGQL